MERRFVLALFLVSVGTARCTIVDTFGPLAAELDVYTVAVQEACSECDREPYGVADTTVDMETLLGSEVDQGEYVQLLRGSFPTLMRGTLDDFVRQNTDAYPMSDGFYSGLPGTPEVVRNRVFEQLHDKRSSCLEQCRKLDSSNQGLFRLSRVGFNSELATETQQAFLYMENFCGDPCGQARFVLFVLDGDGWVIEQIQDLWSF